MNVEPERWTMEERRRALNAFFDGEEGRRFLDVFSRECTAEEDRAVFLRDAERRLPPEAGEASRWWQSLRVLVNDARHRDLALAEMLAQSGIDVEELYEALPERFEPSALAQAVTLLHSQQAGGLAPGISDIAGWSDERISIRLEEVRPQLNVTGASEKARDWWEAFERESDRKKAPILRLTEELALRKATVDEFFEARTHSNTENIQAILHYLDYMRRKQGAGQRADDGVRLGLSTDPTGWWMKPAKKITRVKGWTEEQIRARLGEVTSGTGWKMADAGVRAWWESFDARNSQRPALLLRVAEELAAREANVTSFYRAYEQSGAEDIRANLDYLDYLRLKAKAEQEKADDEGRKQRLEQRRKNQEERMAKARARFAELLPLFDSIHPTPELSAADQAILLNLPREDVPADAREWFEQAIGSFNYETVRLDETGQVTERRQLRASRQVEELIPGVALELVEVPGGAFLIGSPEGEAGRSKDEGPQQRVTVRPFYIGKFTITQEQWAVVAGWEKVERDLDPDPARFKGDDRPVETISWEDAKEFCARLSRKTGREYRLPTEAEWEYACRAGTTTPFTFGETITPEIVNYNGEYPYAKAKKGENRGETVPVGSLGVANPFGLFDMHGNVWEWCEDDWHENYSEAPADGRAWVSDISRRASARVDRGGGWDGRAADCRSARRVDDAPGYRGGALGVRLVRT